MKFIVILFVIAVTSAHADVRFRAAFDPVVQAQDEIERAGLLTHYLIYLCDAPIPDNPGRGVDNPENPDNPVTCPGTLAIVKSDPVRSDGSGYIVGQREVEAPACPEAVTIKIEAEDFDAGLSREAFFDRTPGNVFSGVSYRSDPHDVDIRRISGGHAIGDNYPGEWVRYTVRAPRAGPYKLIANISNDDQSSIGFVHLGTDETLSVRKPKPDIPDPWNQFEAIEAGEVYMQLVEGEQHIRLQIVHGNTDVDWFTFSQAAGPEDCNPIPPAVMEVTYETSRKSGPIYMRAAAISDKGSRSALSNMVAATIESLMRRPKAPANLRRVGQQ